MAVKSLEQYKKLKIFTPKDVVEYISNQFKGIFKAEIESEKLGIKTNDEYWPLFNIFKGEESLGLLYLNAIKIKSPESMLSAFSGLSSGDYKGEIMLVKYFDNSDAIFMKGTSFKDIKPALTKINEYARQFEDAQIDVGRKGQLFKQDEKRFIDNIEHLIENYQF